MRVDTATSSSTAAVQQDPTELPAVLLYSAAEHRALPQVAQELEG
jgi:hypothetical protein